MKIYTLWGQRLVSGNSGEPVIELLVAWDEYSVDENADGWEAAKAAAIKDIGEDLVQWREAFLYADDAVLEKLFEIPDLSKPVSGLTFPPGVR